MQVMTTTTTSVGTKGPAARPLRADAERNRALIIEAAAQVFAEKGLDAGFDEIARRAGVGTGTVYRRFPDRDGLIEALLVDSFDKMTVLAQEAIDTEDAWVGLTNFFRSSIRLQMKDQGLHEMLKANGPWADLAPAAKAKFIPVLNSVLDRAKAQGRIREDVGLTDLGVLMTMVSTVHDPDQPDLWERYLVLVLDSLASSRTGPTPLPARAPSDSRLHEHLERTSGIRSRSGSDTGSGLC
ncbi:TetR/AcrR family transcriptional regulator [Nakamurella silvestris]|nr:TetR/AcrR family transcriptional regulator [Nakamurella silvestris]